MIEFGYFIYFGMCCEFNEDIYYGDSELVLWLVVDGMGGYVCGEVVSVLVCEMIVCEICRGVLLVQVICIVDEEIICVLCWCNDILLMGIIVVVVCVQGNCYEVVWVGDSCVYLWCDGQLVQFSQDYSVVQELVVQGNLIVEQVCVYLYCNVVIQVLGVIDFVYLNVVIISGELCLGM